jgi:hypothetical protein
VIIAATAAGVLIAGLFGSASRLWRWKRGRAAKAEARDQGPIGRHTDVDYILRANTFPRSVSHPRPALVAAIGCEIIPEKPKPSMGAGTVALPAGSPAV